ALSRLPARDTPRRVRSCDVDTVELAGIPLSGPARKASVSAGGSGVDLSPTYEEANMDATVVAVIVIVLIVLAIAVLFAAPAAKRRRLRKRFGPEYERRVEDHGDRKAAEREMRDLATQRDKLD